jgi:hypothetical protein
MELRAIFGFLVAHLQVMKLEHQWTGAVYRSVNVEPRRIAAADAS